MGEEYFRRQTMKKILVLVETPSKRLYKIFPDYEKVADGPVIVEKIGLKKIREECAHFDRWVTRLEKL